LGSAAISDPESPPVLGLMVGAATAAALPSLLAFNLSPSPTFLNQALALLLWPLFLLALAPAGPPLLRAARDAGSLLVAITLVGLSALASWLLGALPASLALSAIGLLAVAALLLVGGAVAGGHTQAVAWFEAFCLGWVAAGVLNMAVAIVQVFLPDLADGDWIAASGMVGRAVGNFRQPNHLSSLLVWSMVAVVFLQQAGRLRLSWAGGLFGLFVFGVVLTASRTGWVSMFVLTLWALADRGLRRPTRLLVGSAPLVYALGYGLMAWWASAGEQAFGGTARLAESDVSGSRFSIWANTLELIRREPWWGVGFGEFNYAWTLTPFPGRPIAFFDHTHNLPLQLAVEMGLPAAVTVMLLLCLGLAFAWRRAGPGTAGRSVAGRTAFAMVLLIGLHSLLEYPLWYAYFLLPAAWAWGFALGRPAVQADTTNRSAHRPWLPGLAALAAAGALLSVADYFRVVPIFEADADAPPLLQRIADGQGSVLFSHHADYAAATTEIAPALRAQAFDGATHYLLDTRLTLAWAQALAARGEIDKARHLAARLREFRNPLSADFLALCESAEKPSSPPFQCQAASREFHWREFLPR
jgi:O-antigen ligase